MKKYLAYVKDIDRVFIDIYEAESKDDVKRQLLIDCSDFMTKIRQKRTKTMTIEDRFITTIYEMNDDWLRIWTQKHTCIECKNQYTKLEKAQMNARGIGEFCSEECYRQHNIRFAPPSSYDRGAVYMITHLPSGKKYIGVTTRWLMQRWWEHYKADSGSPLHKLIKQDGIEQFTFQIVAEFKPSETDAYEIEALYIRDYNAVADGLNAVSGHEMKVIAQ